MLPPSVCIFFSNVWAQSGPLSLSLLAFGHLDWLSAYWCGSFSCSGKVLLEDQPALPGPFPSTTVSYKIVQMSNRTLPITSPSVTCYKELSSVHSKISWIGCAQPYFPSIRYQWLKSLVSTRACDWDFLQLPKDGLTSPFLNQISCSRCALQHHLCCLTSDSYPQPLSWLIICPGVKLHPFSSLTEPNLPAIAVHPVFCASLHCSALVMRVIPSYLHNPYEVWALQLCIGHQLACSSCCVH